MNWMVAMLSELCEKKKWNFPFRHAYCPNLVFPLNIFREYLSLKKRGKNREAREWFVFLSYIKLSAISLSFLTIIISHPLSLYLRCETHHHREFFQ